MDCKGLKIVVHKITRKTSKIIVSSNQDSTEVKNDLNGRTGMVLVRCLRKAIYWRFGRQGEIRSRFQVSDIEGRGTYQRSQVEGGTDLTPPSWHQGDWGRAQVRREHIRGQWVNKEEEWRVVLGGYRRQGNPIRNKLFTDTSKSPESVFCACFFDNTGTLSLSGSTCIMLYLDLIEFPRLPTRFTQPPYLRYQENPVMIQGKGGRPNPGP